VSQVVDIAIVIVVALTVLGGLRRGLRRELINLAGVVIALLGGVFLARPAASLIARFGVLEEVPWLLAFIGGFLAASLLFSLLKAPLLPREIDLAERISGGVVGLGKGVVLAALLLYLLLGIWPDGAGRLTAAPAARLVLPVVEVVDRVAGAVRVLLPRDFTERVRTTWEGVRRSGREVSETLETIRQAGEQAREYGRTVGQGAAVVDSLLHPPPPRP
jgi:hypothetical protein